MSASFWLSVACAAALVAYATSLATGALLLLPQGARSQLSPAARARLLLCWSLLPALACLVVTTLALSPMFGWIADHCMPAGDSHAGSSHGHPHICEHHVAAWPGLPVACIAGLFVARLGIGVFTLALHGGRATRLNRQLRALSQPRGAMHVLPLPAPQAFVIGILRPVVFVTRGLLTQHREHLAAVLAHEHAHVRRADALRMLCANLGLWFHLPGLAGAVHARLACAQEMAADAQAALALGSRARVARALIALTRAQRRGPGLAFGLGAFEFAASDTELRVQDLLVEAPRHDFPRRAPLLLLLAAGCVALAMHAPSVHHGVEQALGLVSP